MTTPTSALIKAALDDAQNLDFIKTPQSSGTSLQASLWKVAGFPVAGATPPAYTAGSGYTCSSATAGALPLVNAASGDMYIGEANISLASPGTLIVYDRLWACSGFSATSILSQAITTPGTIPARDRDAATAGNGVEMWLECYTSTGTVITSNTITVDYTNQSGTASRSAVYTGIGNTLVANDFVAMTLQSGDSGVGAVASAIMALTIVTGGDFGITLARPLAKIAMGRGTFTNIFSHHHRRVDALRLALRKVYPSSCLAFRMLRNTSAAQTVGGALKVITI